MICLHVKMTKSLGKGRGRRELEMTTGHPYSVLERTTMRRGTEVTQAGDLNYSS
jgi:hypothetical protein